MSESVRGWLRWRERWRRYVTPRADGEMVVVWWELRRGFYNLILVLWLAFNLIAWSVASGVHRLSDHGRHHDAMTLGSWRNDVLLCLVWGVVLQVAANFWYCGGWLTDLLWSKMRGVQARRFGPNALVGGTIFSLFFSEWFYWATLAERVF